MNYHVVLKNGCWSVINTGSNVESSHATKEEAIGSASNLARLEGGLVTFHGEKEVSYPLFESSSF